MIPPLDHRGLLPEGVFSTEGWSEIDDRFAFNRLRITRLDAMRKFVRQELFAVAGGLDLWLGGSYFSDIADPGDIDCTILVPFDELPRRPALMVLFNDGGKGRIWHQYGVELYPSFELAGLNDFRLFFQYVGEKTAARKQLHEKDKRGIIKVESWTLG